MRQIYRRKQKGNKHKDKLKDRFFSLLLIISIFMFIGSVIQTSGKIKQVNKEVSDRQNQLASLKNEREELKRKLDEITSEGYMEKQLRDQLNLSKENEVVLILPSDDILRALVPKDDEEQGVDLKPNWRKWADIFGILIGF